MKKPRFSRQTFYNRLEVYRVQLEASPASPMKEAVLNFLCGLKAELVGWTNTKALKGNLYGSKAVKREL